MFEIEIGCSKVPRCPSFSNCLISLVSELHSNEKPIIHFLCLVSFLKTVGTEDQEKNIGCSPQTFFWKKTW